MRHRSRRTTRRFLFVSDFDKTLSLNDSGNVLSEMMGVRGFEEKVARLSRLNLVQQGGELAYLLLHDGDYAAVTRADLARVGQHVALKRNIEKLCRMLESGFEQHAFDVFVISAAPEDVIRSALEGILPEDHVFGARFEYTPDGRIASLGRVPAGYGKVAVLEELRARTQVSDDRVIYCGDGSSDIHVMLHVNQKGGFTIAVSEAKHISQIARRTVLADEASSVLVPILEDLCEWAPPQVRLLFEANGLVIQEWGKVRTDWLTIAPSSVAAAERAT